MSSHPGTDYLKRVIYDLMLYRRSSLEDTARLKERAHDKDLCPLLESQLETVTRQFERYRKAASDIQGPRDRGVDVILKYENEGGEKSETLIIGFQVKSYGDLNVDGWLTKLKAQCLEALTTRSLVDFYVLICTDSVEHKKKLRAVNAELAEVKGVTVVSPQHAYTFLHLAEHEIGAYVKAKLSLDDVVYTKAVESIVELTPTETAIVIELIARQVFEGELQTPVSALRSAPFVTHTYDTLPDVDRDFYFGSKDYYGEEFGPQHLWDRSAEARFKEEFIHLDGTQIQTSNWDDTATVLLDDYRAIQALMLDATVRNDLTPQDLRSFTLHSLLGESIKKGMEFRPDEDG